MEGRGRREADADFDLKTIAEGLRSRNLLVERADRGIQLTQVLSLLVELRPFLKGFTQSYRVTELQSYRITASG